MQSLESHLLLRILFEFHSYLYYQSSKFSNPFFIFDILQTHKHVRTTPHNTVNKAFFRYNSIVASLVPLA